jgi:hypothetical protein
MRERVSGRLGVEVVVAFELITRTSSYGVHLSAFLANVLRTELIDLPQTLSACGTDAVVLDKADAYLSLGPMHLDMPYYVSVANAFHSNSPDRCRYVKLRQHSGHNIGGNCGLSMNNSTSTVSSGSNSPSETEITNAFFPGQNFQPRGIRTMPGNGSGIGR